jgi:hypothetical protein
LERLYYPTAEGIASAVHELVRPQARPWTPERVEAPEIMEFKGPF